MTAGPGARRTPLAVASTAPPSAPPAADTGWPRRWRSARVAAALTAFAGLLNLFSAFLPTQRDRLGALDDLVPGVVSEGATVATAAAGVGLLLLAGGLLRRQRKAWLAAVVLLAGSAALHLAKGLDVEEALIEVFLTGLLLGQAGSFSARTGPLDRRAALGPAVVALLATAGYGVLGLAVNARSVVARLGAARLVGEVGRMALGLGTQVPLGGRFGRVFPGSVAAVFYAGMLLAAARLLAPALARPARDPGLRAAVAVSDDSLAYFALRDDRLAVRGGRSLVSWAPVRMVALAAGDPLGPRVDWPAAVDAFLAEAAAHGRIPAVVGCGAEAAEIWRAAGLAPMYLGDEAILDLGGFTLDGRARRIARQSWRRAQRAGLTAAVYRTGDLRPAEAAALRGLSARWRGGAAERGFSMALGRLFDRRDADALVVVGRDRGGRPLGFLHLVPWGDDGASLDVMRRERDAPAILNDFLVVEAARRLPAYGVGRLSLNFAFLRGLLAASGGPPMSRVAGWGLRRLSRPFQVESLYRFNQKFDPDWRPRYLAAQAPEALPRVALACLQAEGLLAPLARAGRWSAAARRTRAAAWPPRRPGSR